MALAGLAATSLMTSAPAIAFDDSAFCVAAQQFALAANQDIGLWIDRTTRSGGMVVSCDTKRVEFKRFTSVSSVSISGSWKDRKAEEWNASHCNSPIWAEAIRNGWQIALRLMATDGGQLELNARCG
jgi:hypothetical protein